MSFKHFLSGLNAAQKIWMLPLVTILRTPVPLVLNNPELNLRMYFSNSVFSKHWTRLVAV